MLCRAVDLGITCFDTAPAYGLGRAEEILAEALGPRRADIAVVTKCGIPFIPEERKFGRNATYDHIVESTEESLRRASGDRPRTLTRRSGCFGGRSISA